MKNDRARLRAAAGADRAAAGRAARRVPAARLRPREAATCGTARFAELPEELRGRARRRQRHARRAGAHPDRASRRRRGAAARARRRTASGRGSRGPRGGSGRAGATGRWSCSSTSARAAGGCGSTASRRARCRCRRTSPSRSPIPSATRPSTRASRARPRRRPPGSTSRRSCSARLDVERVTLHVGLDTFRPVTADDARGARAARRALRGAAGGVGADPRGRARARRRHDDGARARDARARRAARRPHRRSSSRPGFEFRRVDALLTNFHLPRSTLLALVMAFAGVEETRELYRLAVDERYRFYSFGDAMLIL